MMSGRSLYPHQAMMLDEASALFRDGHRRVLIQGATGIGKTVLSASMLASAAGKGFRSYFIVHRRELLKQTSRTFTATNVDHAVIAAGFDADPTKLVQIASIGTLARQRDAITSPPRFVVWDEAHHMPAPGWSALQEVFAGAFHVGLSATPMRLDGKGLSDHFDAIVRGPSIEWLERRGYLAQSRHYAPRSLDVTGVRVRMGDYVRGELAAAIERSTINRDAVAAYQRYARACRALIFAVSIEQSQLAVEAFSAAGIIAEHVDGKTPVADRDAAIERFETGQTTVLSNVDLFGEGFDLPALGCVIMLRATWSLALYLQMIGRALRKAEGKDHAVILDLVGNYRRHGLVEEDRKWSLHPAPTAFVERADLTVCDACALVYCKRHHCPACGAPPRPRRAADVEAWNSLIASPGLADRIRRMPYGSAIRWGSTEHELRQVALARGFKSGWAYHRARELEATQR